MNSKKAVFFLVFAAIILCPLAFFDFSDGLSTENRLKEKFPDLPASVSELKTFTGRLEAWFNDRIGFRKELISLYNKTLVSVFGILPADNLVLGKDGTVFLTAASHATVRHDDVLSAFGGNQDWENSVKLQKKLIKDAWDWMGEAGVKTVFLAVPTSPVVRFGDLPDFLQKMIEKKKEGQLNLDFLIIEEDPQIVKIKPHNVNVKVKSISDGINEKLIIDDYDENKIDLEIGMCICNPCDVLYISEKMCSKDFTKKRRLCRISKENYAQDYFVESNGEKHFLQFGTDFFIFDFKEFYKQMYGSIDKNVSKSEFHKYIKEFFYDYKIVSKLCRYEIELSKLCCDPIQYILNKCYTILLKEYDQEKIKIIQAYCEAISDKKIKWTEQCEKYWPDEYKNRDDINRYVNGRHERFKRIAKENGIPYIKVHILRDMTDQTRPQVIEEMRRQLETMWRKDNF